MEAFVDFFSAIYIDVSSSMIDRWDDYTPWFLFYCSLHVLFEFGIPFIAPGVYDVLSRRDARKAFEAGRTAPPLNRARLAQQARTSLTSVIMAFHVTSVSLFALTLSPSVRALGNNLYGEVPLTRHLINVSVGFFLWDLGIVVLDGMAAEYVIHAVACLLVFAAAQRPFLHNMAAVVLLFEASTPFLKLREALLSADMAEGVLFKLNNLVFSLSFFLVRIVFGYWRGVHFWIQIETQIHNGLIQNVPIARLYECLSGGLTILNTIWMLRIVKGAVRNEGLSPRVVVPIKTE